MVFGFLRVCFTFSVLVYSVVFEDIASFGSLPCLPNSVGVYFCFFANFWSFASVFLASSVAIASRSFF